MDHCWTVFRSISEDKNRAIEQKCLTFVSPAPLLLQYQYSQYLQCFVVVLVIFSILRYTFSRNYTKTVAWKIKLSKVKHTYTYYIFPSPICTIWENQIWDQQLKYLHVYRQLSVDKGTHLEVTVHRWVKINCSSEFMSNSSTLSSFHTTLLNLMWCS